ncbi:MAG: 50S ribosomal protein L6 [Sandaracinaceae bacterium]|nr:50S ribosomal protein L6 [Sandaracinaceae bacterium]
MTTETQAESQVLRVSRVGKRAVPLPKNVTVELAGNVFKCKGPKGSLERTFHKEIVLAKDGDSIVVNPAAGARAFAQYQGLTRALVANMVKGVSEGYKLSLDLYGVGYRAAVQGGELVLNLGLSHPVHHPLHPAVKATVETIDEAGTKRPRVHLESYDKEALGQTAAKLRSYRPPEPYKGKGVRHTGERVREKAGKAGGKGGK